jgi:hypothetical protein
VILEDIQGNGRYTDIGNALDFLNGQIPLNYRKQKTCNTFSCSPTGSRKLHRKALISQKTAASPANFWRTPKKSNSKAGQFTYWVWVQKPKQEK